MLDRRSLLVAPFFALLSSAAFGQTTIPAGTTIAVKTIDKIDSENSQSGTTYRASLADALVLKGKTVAPVGSDAVLRVVEAKKAGKLKGNAQLTVALVSLKMNGRTVRVNTDVSTSSSSGKGKSSAIKTGIGAGLGAAIGAVAGGGKGAAIGAGIGGAGGAGVATLTGPKVVIPAETRLSFVTR